MAFHWKDGWYFERLDTEGNVRIYHEEKGQTEEPKECDVVLDIDPDSWASIIASVSARGETGSTFHEAQKYHNQQK